LKNFQIRQIRKFDTNNVPEKIKFVKEKIHSRQKKFLELVEFESFSGVEKNLT